jgi:hypothetical protein
LHYGGYNLDSLLQGAKSAKEMVALMGGNMEVSSKKNEGTQVRFTLELHLGNPSKLVNFSTKNIKNSLKNKRILLVEVNDMNRFIAVKSLQYFGCEVT